MSPRTSVPNNSKIEPTASDISFRRKQTRVSFLSIACLYFLFRGSLLADFTWNPTNLYNGSQPPGVAAWTTQWVPGPNGTGQSIQVTVSGTGYYNYIVIPRSYLNPNITQFKAVLSFRVATPTVLPKHFYMFARCTGVTGVPDIWQKFVGEPSDGARTIEFPIEMKPVTGGTWYFYAGTYGPGSLIVDSLVIKDGWGLTNQLAIANATPVSLIPSGVTAATGAPATIAIDPPAAGTVTTMTASNLVADVGGVPVSSAIAAQNSTRLQAWLNTAKTTGGTKKILIPPGIYRFENPSNDGLVIRDTNDLTIDGQGAEFIFQRLYFGQNFLLTNCNRVVIKNLNLDWNWAYKPIASLAKVLSLSSDNKTVVFQFPTQTAAQTLLTRHSTWSTLFPMNPTTLCRDGAEFFSMSFNNLNPPTSLVESGNQITATFALPLSLALNRHYVIKHLYYEMIAFKLTGCTHLTFDSINIYSTPGMGWLNTEASHHLKWNNCKIARRTGSTYPLVTGADGLHSLESKGDFVIQNSTFTGLGDDAINLHDNCWQGGLFYTTNPNQLRLTNCPADQLRLKSGNTIRFYHPDYSSTGITATLAADPTFTFPTGGSSYSDTATALVTLTAPAPQGLSHFSIVNNDRFETKNVKIAACVFSYTNGRAVLLSAKNATINSCYFRNVSSTSLQITTEIVGTAFMEGRGASNVVVSNNTFERCNEAGSKWGLATVYVGAVLPWGPADYPLFSTLLFDSNRFYNPPGPSIAFNSTKNVIVRNNRIQYLTAMANATPAASSIQVLLSADMALGGNTWTNWLTGPFTKGVAYDSVSSNNLEYRTNRSE